MEGFEAVLRRVETPHNSEFHEGHDFERKDVGKFRLFVLTGF